MTGAALRDVQEVASLADPRAAIRYDRARRSLDRHGPTSSPPSSAEPAASPDPGRRHHRCVGSPPLSAGSRTLGGCSISRSGRWVTTSVNSPFGSKTGLLSIATIRSPTWRPARSAPKESIYRSSLRTSSTTPPIPSTLDLDKPSATWRHQTNSPKGPPHNKVRGIMWWCGDHRDGVGRVSGDDSAPSR